jgi:hypothetical protein
MMTKPIKSGRISVTVAKLQLKLTRWRMLLWRPCNLRQ